MKTEFKFGEVTTSIWKPSNQINLLYGPRGVNMFLKHWVAELKKLWQRAWGDFGLFNAKSDFTATTWVRAFIFVITGERTQLDFSEAKQKMITSTIFGFVPVFFNFQISFQKHDVAFFAISPELFEPQWRRLHIIEYLSIELKTRLS